MVSESQKSKFYFVGNDRCLDFINTEVRANDQSLDLLTEFDDVLAWLAQGNILDAEEAKALGKRWAGKPEAEKTLRQARELRVILRLMVERITHGKSVPQIAIEAINDLLRNQVGYTELRRAKGNFEKRYHLNFDDPRRLLIPLAESATDLLCYADFSLIKQCENPACVLYFYDTTKNHTRRWCSMSMCGNRAKAAAHYRRVREAKHMVGNR